MNPYESAQVVLPLVVKGWIPRRVLDVGCGDGSWLRAAQDLWGSKTTGLDQGISVGLGFLGVDDYRRVDLAVKEVPPQGRFDLAICLEVGEHLASDYARGLVKFLCNSAPLVVFSAAHPGQGPYPPAAKAEATVGDVETDEALATAIFGVKSSPWHINEQLSAYWKDLFWSFGYESRDTIRLSSFVQDSPDVDPWYKSNIFLAVRS